jgi:hypothetical protein
MWKTLPLFVVQNVTSDDWLSYPDKWKEVEGIIIISIIIIIIIIDLQHFVGPWPLFQFLDPIHSR